MKRRVGLVALILLVLGAVAGGLGWYIHRSRGPKLLARVELALRAERFDRALELAGSYIARHPDDWRGYYFQGLTHNRLGRYADARKSLDEAARLAPEEVPVRIALSETHALPARRTLAAGEPGAIQTDRMTEAISKLRQANEDLAGVRTADRKLDLDVRQQVGLNELQIGWACREMAKSLEQEAARAEAAGAAELGASKRQAHRQAAADADHWLSQSIRTLLAVVTADPRREQSARVLVEECLKRNDRASLEAARKAILALPDPPPVAATRLALDDLQSTTQPADSPEYRRLLSETCDKIQGILDRHPDELEVKLARAELALALEDLPTAERLCKEVLKVDKAQARAGLMDASIDMIRGNSAEAERKLTVLRTAHPTWPEAHLAYARAALANGRKEMAKDAMRTVTRLDPDNAQARRYMAESLLRDGHHKEAFEDAQAYHQASPTDPAALRLFVEACKHTGREDMAREAIQAARQSDRPDMLMAVAESYAFMGDNAEMLKAARETAALKPGTFEARLAVARALIATDRAAEAETILREALASTRQAHRVHFELGNLYDRTGRSAQALEQYRTTARLEPTHIPYRLALAQALFDAALLDECQAECQEVLQRDRNNPTAILLTNQVRILQGQPVSIEQLAGQSSSGPQGGLPLALTFLAHGQPDRCVELCQAELARSPDDRQFRLLLGQAHLALGQRDKCLEEWTKLLAAAPDQLGMYLRLAGAMGADISGEQVRAKLAALPKARPELVDMATGWLHDRGGDYEPAAEAFGRVVARTDLPDDFRQQAAMFRVQSLARGGRLEQAITEVDRLVSESARGVEARLAKAQLLMAVSRPAEAEAILEELARTAGDVQDPYCLVRVAGLYSRMDNRLDKALAACDRIQQIIPRDARGYLAKANILAGAGNHRQAVEWYQKASDCQPGNFGIYLAMVDALEADDEPHKAMEVLGRLESLGPSGRSEALYRKGVLMARHGLQANAAECFEQLASSGYENDPRLQFALGQAFGRLGLKEKARPALERVPPYSTAYVPAQQMLADLADSPDDKLAVLDRLESSPTGRAQPGVLLQRMDVLLEAGRPADAVKAFARFSGEHLKGRPIPAPVANVALQAMLAADDRPAAAGLAARVFKESDSSRWRALAVLLMLDDKPQAAGELLPDAPKAETYDCLLGLCLAAGSPGSSAASARWHQRLIELAARPAGTGSQRAVPPSYMLLAALTAGNPAQAKDALGRMDRASGLVGRVTAEAFLSAEGNKADAPVLLKSTVALDAGLPVLARDWAMSLLKARPTCQWAAAVVLQARSDQQTLGKVLELLQPADCLMAHVVRARRLAQEGKFAEAADTYELAAKSASNDPAMLMSRAGALESAGRLNEALEIYRQVWKLLADPVAANNAAYLVSLLSPEDSGQLAEARTWLDTAIKGAPDNPAFRDTRGWLAHLQGRNEQALKDLRFAVRGLPDSPEVHYHLGVVEAASGNADSARRHLAAAIQSGDRLKQRNRTIAPSAAKAVEEARALLARMEKPPS